MLGDGGLARVLRSGVGVRGRVLRGDAVLGGVQTGPTRKAEPLCLGQLLLLDYPKKEKKSKGG